MIQTASFVYGRSSGVPLRVSTCARNSLGGWRGLVIGEPRSRPMQSPASRTLTRSFAPCSGNLHQTGRDLMPHRSAGILNKLVKQQTTQAGAA